MGSKKYYVEIDVLDLVKYLISKYKQFLTAMFIGIILFGGYSLLESKIFKKDDVLVPLFTLSEQEKVVKYLEFQDVIESLREDLNKETDFEIKIELTNLIINVQSKVDNLNLTENQLKKISTYDSNKQSIEEFVVSDVILDQTNNIFKNMTLGAICGIFVVCIIYSLFYVLSGVIKTKQELKELGLFVLGDVKDYEIISSHLKEITTKEIAYASTLDISMIPSNLSCVGNPLKEVDGLKSVYNKDVVLIEKLKETNRQSIIDLKEFLEYSGFRIIGIILL